MHVEGRFLFEQVVVRPRRHYIVVAALLVALIVFQRHDSEDGETEVRIKHV